MHSFRRWLVALPAVIGATMAFGAAAAMASPSTNIDDSGWPSSASNSCAAQLSYTADMCLWYGQNGGNPIWGTSGTGVSTLSGDFFGSSTLVRNDAASMYDFFVSCHVATWVDTGYVGPANYLLALNGGNLTSNPTFPLRNNEASIQANTC